MNKSHKLLIVFIVMYNLYGCATSSLLNYSGKTVTTPTVHLDKYIDGVITDKNIALLCFTSNKGKHNGNAFTVELDLNYYFNYFNKNIKYYKDNDILMYKHLQIGKKFLHNGCSTLPYGKKLVPYTKKITSIIENWDSLNNNYNDISLFIPAQNKQGPILYLSLNHESHMALLLRQEYDKSINCALCYVGVPFTFVLDVITSPIQAIVYFGLDH